MFAVDGANVAVSHYRTPQSYSMNGAGSDACPFSSTLTTTPITVDRWQFGLEALLPLIDLEHYRERRHAFRNLGLLARSNDERAITMTLPISLLDGRHAGSVTAELFLRQVESGGSLITGDIRGNGLLSLRALLGDDRAGPEGIDKRLNVIGPTHCLENHHFDDCVASLPAGVTAVAMAISELTGCDLVSLETAALRLRALELTIDHNQPDATSLAHRVTRGVFRCLRYLDTHLGG